MCCVAFMKRAAVRGGVMTWPRARSICICCVYTTLFRVLYDFTISACYLGVGSSSFRISSEHCPGSVSTEAEAEAEADAPISLTPPEI